jgi:hypothetical protein
MAMSQQSLLKFFGRQIEKSAEKRKTPPVVQGFKSESRFHEITVLTRTTNIWEYASPGLVRWSKIF